MEDSQAIGISLNVEKYTTACEDDLELKKKKWTTPTVTEEVSNMPRIVHVPLVLAKTNTSQRRKPYAV